MNVRERMAAAPWGVRVILLATVIALASAALHVWWVPALAGGVFGLVSVRRGAVGAVTIPLAAGLLGWGALVVVALTRGGAGRVAEVMSGILGLPVWLTWLLTPLYGALLAGSAALLLSAVRMESVSDA